MFSLMDRLPQVISETAEVLAANRRTLVGKRRKRGKILSSKKILEFLEIHDSARGFFLVSGFLACQRWDSCGLSGLWPPLTTACLMQDVWLNTMTLWTSAEEHRESSVQPAMNAKIITSTRKNSKIPCAFIQVFHESGFFL